MAISWLLLPAGWLLAAASSCCLLFLAITSDWQWFLTIPIDSYKFTLISTCGFVAIPSDSYRSLRIPTDSSWFVQIPKESSTFLTSPTDSKPSSLLAALDPAENCHSPQGPRDRKMDSNLEQCWKRTWHTCKETPRLLHGITRNNTKIWKKLSK